MRQLSALLVRNVKHGGGKPSPDKYYDLHGLILRVSPGGRKYWIWRGTVHGRRRDYGLGQYPYMSLAEARQKAFEYRKLALGGTDPKAAGHNVPTFQQAAEKVIRQQRKTWTPGGGSEGQWRSSLDTYAFPHLGKMRVDKITAREVIGCLQDRDFWTRKATTAKRVKKRISLVMQWAVAQGYRGNNPAGDAIDAALGPQPTEKQSFKALPHAEAAAAIAKIRAAKAWAGTKLALEFLALTAVRSGEVRAATWDQINLSERVWTIGKTKTGQPHRVPIAPRAVRILEEAGGHWGREGRVFPGARLGPMCANSMGRVLKAQDINCDPHGWRSSFKSWTADEGIDRGVAEVCLAHKVGGVEGAYLRTDILERRRPVMEAWAAYIGGCQGPRASNARPVRSGEGRGAVWTEIDRDEGVSTIPAWRTKGNREHRGPAGPTWG